MFRTAIFKNARKDLAVLGKIAQNSEELFNDFYLAGGTALAMQLGHRVSFDLDFFTEKTFNPENLLRTIKLSGDCISIKDVEISKGTLKFKCNTNISFFDYPYKLIAPIVKVQEYPWLKLASIEDIALMKVTAISSRAEKKDFIDLYFAIKELNWTQEILLERLKEKYQDANYQHLILSLTWFRDADKDNTELKLLKKVDWQEVKRFFKDWIK